MNPHGVFRSDPVAKQVNQETDTMQTPTVLHKLLMNTDVIIHKTTDRE